MKVQTATTIDENEIERFTRIAKEWWNPVGKFAPLHRINPLRIQWILDQVGGDVQGKSLLDIGCGGGLLAEPMARLGARVTGIDAGEQNIAVAKLHAEQSELEIDYRHTSAEELATGHKQFDIVLAMEIIEHVADIPLFVKSSCALVKSGGTLIFTTLNRTPKSYALAILGAEYVLRWLPIGTHSWKKFVKPSELHLQLRRNNIEVTTMAGMTMNPFTFEWRIEANDLSVNYLVAGKKSA